MHDSPDVRFSHSNGSIIELPEVDITGKVDKTAQLSLKATRMLCSICLPYRESQTRIMTVKDTYCIGHNTFLYCIHVACIRQGWLL